MRRAIAVTAALLGGALIVAAALLGSVLIAEILVQPAFAHSPGDIAANRALDARCRKTSNLGSVVWGYCTDRNK